jgi:hypothetical protein
MRPRALRLLLPISAALLLAACSGADATRASQLLATAQAAQAKLVSATYDARVVVTQGDRSFTLLMNGGGYLKGSRAGDQFMSMRAEGLPVPLQFELVSVNGRGFVRTNGTSQSFPVPAGGAGSRSSNWTGIVGDLAKYVKSVDVHERTVVAGEPGTTVVGVIDTAGLVKAAAGLSTFSRAAGVPSVDELTKHLGDTRAILVISARTHLIRTAVVTIDVKAGDKSTKVQIFYALRSINRRISIPNPY